MTILHRDDCNITLPHIEKHREYQLQCKCSDNDNGNTACHLACN